MIIASAIKTKAGSVFVGKRHSNCFSMFAKLVENPNYDNIIQGFINDKLEFLDRRQAYREARANNQCREFNKPYLTSEDLW